MDHAQQKMDTILICMRNGLKNDNNIDMWMVYQQTFLFPDYTIWTFNKLTLLQIAKIGCSFIIIKQ